MKIEIESKRLFFRPLIESDAVQTYADWLNDSDVNRYLETRHEVQTIESCRTFIQHCNQDPFSNLFGVFLRESGKHIGNAKLGNVNLHHARAELSMLIGEKSCWGKGLGTEVVQALTGYGFERLGLKRVQAGCYEKNLQSLRIFLNTGYTVEGFFRHHVMDNGRPSGCFWLSILKHEFI
ncbi:MAG: GNAT family N-acetyltransferase [Burkholderiaceae bacterium]|nr:GNAT family N-acetyltransferase [Burkholderiaceae bacterium]